MSGSEAAQAWRLSNYASQRLGRRLSGDTQLSPSQLQQVTELEQKYCHDMAELMRAEDVKKAALPRVMLNLVSNSLKAIESDKVLETSDNSKTVDLTPIVKDMLEVSHQRGVRGMILAANVWVVHLFRRRLSGASTAPRARDAVLRELPAHSVA